MAEMSGFGTLFIRKVITWRFCKTIYFISQLNDTKLRESSSMDLSLDGGGSLAGSGSDHLS